MHASASSETPSKLPATVVAALCFTAAGFVLAMVRSILMQDWSRPLTSTISVGVLFTIGALWLYGLWRRTRWMWWFTVFSWALGLVFAPWSMSIVRGSTQLVLYWCQLVIAIFAVGLYVSKPSREWYLNRAAT